MVAVRQKIGQFLKRSMIFSLQSPGFILPEPSGSTGPDHVCFGMHWERINPNT